MPIWICYFPALALERPAVQKKNTEILGLPTDTLEAPVIYLQVCRHSFPLSIPNLCDTWVPFLPSFAFSGPQKSLAASLSDAFRAPTSFPSQQIAQPMVEPLLCDVVTSVSSIMTWETNDKQLHLHSLGV